MENENVGISPAPQEETQPQSSSLPAQSAQRTGVSSTAIWVGVIFFVFLLLLIGFAMVQARRRKAEREAELRENLASNTGGLGNGSVDNVTKDVESPDFYMGVEADAKAIYGAGCYAVWYCFTSTNTATVFRILQGKTKRQIAGLNETFQKLYNRTLDNWIQSNMWASDIQKAYQIMLNAK